MNPELFDDPIFKDLEPHRIETLKKLTQELQGKSVTQILLILAKHNKSLMKGRELTKEELETMHQVIYNNLSEADKVSFDKVLNILSKH